MRKNRRLEEGFARPCVSCYSFSTRKKKNKFFFFFFFEKDRESWTLYFLRCKLCLLKVCNQKRASMHIRSDFLAIDRETINCQLIKLIYTRGIKRNKVEMKNIRFETKGSASRLTLFPRGSLEIVRSLQSTKKPNDS